MSNVLASEGKRLLSPPQDQQKKKNSLENNPLVRAVVSWITYNDFLAMKKIMAELRSYGKADRASIKGQSNVKLHPLLLLILNNNNDVTQVDKDGTHIILHHCLRDHMPEANLYSARKMKNDAALVKFLCEMGASLTDKYHYDTPLGIAMRNNRMDLVEAMVGFNSAVPTDCDKDGNTILHTLLEQRIYIKQRKDHNTKLFNVIDELLSRGANLNQPNNEGLTPVHMAAKPFNCEVLKELIRRGADLKCRTSNGDDFLMLACKHTNGSNDHLEANLKWLLKQGLNVNSKNKDGFTPLHVATENRKNLSLVKVLVALGADVHAATNDGTDVYHLAAEEFHYGMIKYYIEQGFELDRRDIVQGIELMFFLPAYIGKDEDPVEWLLMNKFDRHEKGEFTLLHLVASFGYAEIVEEIIERGADVHARGDIYKYTPLHLASMRGKFHTVSELHEVGSIRVKFFEPSVGLYSGQRTCEIRFLKPSRCKIDHESAIRALLKAGADVNAKDRRGRTPLHYAARNEDENNLVAILLQAGASVDEIDLKGISPLHSIFIYGNDDEIMRLLPFGADINDIEHPGLVDYEEIKKLYFLTEPLDNYLLKLKVAGLYVNRLYETIRLVKCDKYFKELEEMKKRMLTSHVSLYDWVRMNWRRRCIYIDDLPSDLSRQVSTLRCHHSKSP